MSKINEFVEKSIILIDTVFDEETEDKLLRELDNLWYAMTEYEQDEVEKQISNYTKSIKERHD